METLPILQISQAHLQVLETCPRKFQHLFLENQMTPIPQTEPQTLGSQFHQLMQQRSLGLDIQPLLVDNPKLQAWVQALDQNPPPFLEGPARHSEYQCTLTLEDFVLIVVCDVLIDNGSRAQIVDWKTYRRPPQVHPLQHHWQTRLYRYVVTEHLGYAPEQVSMLYWFAESAQSGHGAAPWLALDYSAAEHRQTHGDLSRLLKQLRQWMADFNRGSSSFPQVPPPLSTQYCFSPNTPCAFTPHCYPDRTPAASLEPWLDVTAIAEVPLPLP